MDPSQISVAGGRVNVSLKCSACSGCAWNRQQVAWFAEQVARAMYTGTSSSSYAPLSSGGSQPPAKRARASKSPSIAAPPNIGSSTSTISEKAETRVEVKTGKNKPRAKTGCLVCRSRRVKCDEAWPVCTQCKRDSSRTCTYPPRQSPSSFPIPDADPFNLDISRWSAIAPPPPGPDDINATPMIGVPIVNQVVNVPVADTVVGPSVVAPLMSVPPTIHPTAELVTPDDHTLFMAAVSALDSPGLHNVRPSKGGPRNGRVLTRLWEAQLAAFGLASSAQGEFPTAILTAAQALGAAKLAFVDSFPSPNHAEMMAKSRKLAAAAASVIQAYVTGIPGAKDDPETFFILLELFLIRDCSSGDATWYQTHDLTVAYMRSKGGPNAILANYCTAETDTNLVAYHLSYLAVYDSLASLSRGMQPYMLVGENAAWLGRDVSAQTVISTDFGFSVTTLLFIVDVGMCLATGSRGRLPLGQPGIELYDRLNAHALATIYTTPSPRRVQFGDLLIRHALLCHLLLASAQHPPDHPIILQHVDAMQELLVEVASQTGNMINLIYPLLLAGALARGEDRARTTVLLDFARTQTGTVDYVCLTQAIESCWSRGDTGETTKAVLGMFGPLAPFLIC